MSITAKSCRYDTSGFVEELPQLPQNRHSHACASLPITKVRPKQNQPFVQAYIVAGGWISDHWSDRPCGQTCPVVTLLPGATTWTPLASLPWRLRYARASIVGGRIRINGGWWDRYIQGGFGSLRSEVMIEKW